MRGYYANSWLTCSADCLCLFAQACLGQLDRGRVASPFEESETLAPRSGPMANSEKEVAPTWRGWIGSSPKQVASAICVICFKEFSSKTLFVLTVLA